MRILVACPQCRRRYDASGRKIGSRFRCHCGAAVTVEQPKGHDSRVVRCSSCGAPREGGGSACNFCHSDFTLHERDLDTVCPNCFTRVSDTARYCHSCAALLTAENIAGDVTTRRCPACLAPDAQLRSRRLGALDHSLMECDRCAGLWLSSDVFAELTHDAAKQGRGLDPFFARRPQSPPAAPAPAAASSFYRRCAECSKMMVRRNYARCSGIIIDVCSDHGVWFDGDELTRILAWIRAGGKAEATRLILTLRRPPQREVEAQRRGGAHISSAENADHALETWLNEVAAETLDAVVRLFSNKL